MKHDVVSQARSAVDPHQNSVLQRGAKAHRQAVHARARTLVSRPVVGDQTSAFSEDERRSGCEKKKKNTELSLKWHLVTRIS